MFISVNETLKSVDQVENIRNSVELMKEKTTYLNQEKLEHSVKKLIQLTDEHSAVDQIHDIHEFITELLGQAQWANQENGCLAKKHSEMKEFQQKELNFNSSMTSQYKNK